MCRSAVATNLVSENEAGDLVVEQRRSAGHNEVISGVHRRNDDVTRERGPRIVAVHGLDYLVVAAVAQGRHVQTVVDVDVIVVEIFRRYFRSAAFAFVRRLDGGIIDSQVGDFVYLLFGFV